MNGVRRRVPIALVALALFVGASPAAAQFSAEPGILNLVSADSVATASVTVRNLGQAEQQFRVVPYDFDQNPDGGYDFVPPGKNPRSCNARLSVTPTSLTLLPGERQTLRVAVRGAATSCWSLVFVQHVARSGDRGIQAGEQIAVKIYAFPPNATKAAEITKVERIADAAGGKLQVAFDIQGTGEAPVRPAGSVEIRTLTGTVVATVPVDAFSVLPGHVRHIVVTVPASLAKGRYLAVPVLDIGADFLVGGQGQFEVN